MESRASGVDPGGKHDHGNASRGGVRVPAKLSGRAAAEAAGLGERATKALRGAHPGEGYSRGAGRYGTRSAAQRHLVASSFDDTKLVQSDGGVSRGSSSAALRNS